MATLREEIERRRTFAIISHPDAGKTTLTEKFLLYGGAIAPGRRGQGQAERQRTPSPTGWRSKSSAVFPSPPPSCSSSYNGYCINILDTPGHQDFSEDTYRTLMAADSAVMVIDGAKGVEAQTRKLFKVCALRHIPIFTFINKMDREARDPFELLRGDRDGSWASKPIPMNWPIGCGKEFKGVFDRGTRKVLASRKRWPRQRREDGGRDHRRAGRPASGRIDRREPTTRQLADDIELLDGAGRRV